MRKFNYTPNLDLVRAIAIILVLIYHVFQRYNLPIINFFASSGEYGVQLFFVLSGFLVGCLFYGEQKKNNKVNIQKFIFRRISRTLPVYFIVLTFAYLIVLFFKNEVFSIKYVFFLQNYLDIIPFFKVSWSLCVEEHFYLVLPFVLIILNFIKNKWLKFFIVLLIIISPLYFRITESMGKDLSFGYLTNATHLNFDSMSFGVVFAYIYMKTKIIFSPFLRITYIVLPIILLVIFPYFDERFVYTFGKFLLPLSFSLCIFSLATSKQYALSSKRITSIIALSSYSTYLTHAFVLNFCDITYTFKGNNVYLDILVITGTIVSSLILGALFYSIIEKKLMILRDKWVPKTV